jgi:hypothetical protein
MMMSMSSDELLASAGVLVMLVPHLLAVSRKPSAFSRVCKLMKNERGAELLVSVVAHRPASADLRCRQARVQAAARAGGVRP